MVRLMVLMISFMLQKHLEGGKSWVEYKWTSIVPVWQDLHFIDADMGAESAC